MGRGKNSKQQKAKRARSPRPPVQDFLNTSLLPSQWINPHASESVKAKTKQELLDDDVATLFPDMPPLQFTPANAEKEYELSLARRQASPIPEEEYNWEECAQAIEEFDWDAPVEDEHEAFEAAATKDDVDEAAVAATPVDSTDVHVAAVDNNGIHVAAIDNNDIHVASVDSNDVHVATVETMDIDTAPAVKALVAQAPVDEFVDDNPMVEEPVAVSVADVDSNSTEDSLDLIDPEKMQTPILAVSIPMVFEDGALETIDEEDVQSSKTDTREAGTPEPSLSSPLSEHDDREFFVDVELDTDPFPVATQITARTPEKKTTPIAGRASIAAIEKKQMDKRETRATSKKRDTEAFELDIEDVKEKTFKKAKILTKGMVKSKARKAEEEQDELAGIESAPRTPAHAVKSKPIPTTAHTPGLLPSRSLRGRTVDATTPAPATRAAASTPALTSARNKYGFSPRKAGGGAKGRRKSAVEGEKKRREG